MSKVPSTRCADVGSPGIEQSPFSSTWTCTIAKALYASVASIRSQAASPKTKAMMPRSQPSQFLLILRVMAAPSLSGGPGPVDDSGGDENHELGAVVVLSLG